MDEIALCEPKDKSWEEIFKEARRDLNGRIGAAASAPHQPSFVEVHLTDLALDAKLHRLWVVVGINSTALLLVLGRVSHVW
jgi:hypothetical protein